MSKQSGNRQCWGATCEEYSLTPMNNQKGRYIPSFYLNYSEAENAYEKPHIVLINFNIFYLFFIIECVADSRSGELRNRIFSNKIIFLAKEKREFSTFLAIS